MIIFNFYHQHFDLHFRLIHKKEVVSTQICLKMRIFVDFLFENGRIGGSFVKVRCLCCFVFGVFFVGICSAEFQVNTHTSSDQKNADIAMEPGGNFVVVWSSYRQDGNSNGIFGQRFNPDCSPLGKEFQINTTSSGNQTEPAVAMDAAAGFVVAWHGPGLVEEDEQDIFAQRFGPNGSPLGSEFRVNSPTGGRQIYPDVAIGGNGLFIAVWESKNIPDEGKKAICGQLYDSNGMTIGDEFIINEEPAVCRYPTVAADGNGNIVVAWLDDRSKNSILARLFAPDGSARTDTFEVSSVNFSSVTRPSISMNTIGEFIVAWDGNPNLAGLDDIHARLFDQHGAPFGEQFVVNTVRDGPQRYPTVALNDRREFIIVWEIQIGPETSEREIFGQRFNNFGEPSGVEFLINTHVEGDQRYPSVALNEAGTFVTVWQSDDQDGSGYGIFAEAGQIIGSADFNKDGFVDSLDYALLAGQWLEEGAALLADLTYDNKIDQHDLAEFCHHWLINDR